METITNAMIHRMGKRGTKGIEAYKATVKDHVFLSMVLLTLKRARSPEWRLTLLDRAREMFRLFFQEGTRKYFEKVALPAVVRKVDGTIVMVPVVKDCMSLLLDLEKAPGQYHLVPLVLYLMAKFDPGSLAVAINSSKCPNLYAVFTYHTIRGDLSFIGDDTYNKLPGLFLQVDLSPPFITRIAEARAFVAFLSSRGSIITGRPPRDSHATPRLTAGLYPVSSRMFRYCFTPFTDIPLSPSEKTRIVRIWVAALKKAPLKSIFAT